MAGEVELREVTETDLPIFYEHQREPEANRMADFPRREREAFMAHWAKILGDETIVKQTIVFQGRVAGNVVSWVHSGEREVGYWIGKEFWGQGIASQALRAFLGLVTERPLYAHVAKHNLASRRVLEKCGFRLYGEDTWTNPAGGRGEEYILKLE
jgi:RimJ/RimL family protein N-acetyltransferase